MNRTSVLGIRTWSFTSTGNAAVFTTDLWTSEFHPVFRNFNTIPTHTMSGRTDGNTVFIDRKVIFINGWSSTFSIQIDKRCYIFTLKVWFGKQSALSFEQYAYNYMKSGASAVGGCCTTVAKHVEEVVKAKKRFSEEQK